MDIVVNVVNQKLKIASNLKKLISGSQLFVRFVFNLDYEWNDLTIFAQFTQNGNSYNQYLDVDNSVYLPSEITDGYCTMTLYGTGGDVIATTDSVILVIEKNPLIEDASSTAITEPLYTQIINKFEEYCERVIDERSYLAIDTSAASGTDDGDLYNAITVLSWGNEVIE